MTTAPVAAPNPVSISAPAKSPRLLSIDVYRGLTVAAMILVTNPANYAHVYPQLLHAEWNGVTFTDMIAPSFLFVIGVSLSYSFAGRMQRGAGRAQLAIHSMVRVAALIALGLALNGFPDYDLYFLRIPGILQHIAVCLLIGGLLYCWSGRIVSQADRRLADFRARNWILLAAMILLAGADWVLMRFVPVPGYGVGHLDPFGNMGAYVDRSLFGSNHLWPWGNFWWDPDGMMTTLTASCNLILGIVAGDFLWHSTNRIRCVLLLAGGSAVLLACGLLLDPVYPINKKIWTPSYMLFSGGFCLAALAVHHWILDRSAKRQLQQEWLRRLTLPARIFGANAILAFAFTTMANTLAGQIQLHGLDGKLSSLPAVAYQIFAQMLAPRNASLAYALLFVLFNLLLLIPFHRKGVFLKI